MTIDAVLAAPNGGSGQLETTIGDSGVPGALPRANDVPDRALSFLCALLHPHAAALHRIAAASGGLRASRTCTRRKRRGPPGTRAGWVSPADSGTCIVHEIIPDYA
jgi:hypothetical protein